MSFGGTLFGVFTDVIFNACRDVICGVFRDVICGVCRNVILGAFRNVILGTFRDVICGGYEVGGCHAGCEDGESEKAVSSCGQLHFSAHHRVTFAKSLEERCFAFFRLSNFW